MLAAQAADIDATNTAARRVQTTLAHRSLVIRQLSRDSRPPADMRQV
jgi:hypothetical protein